MEKEEEKSYDDSDDKLKKSINNLSKTVIKTIMKEENRVSSSIIERINELNKNGQLVSINLLDNTKQELDKDDN